jgi:hypothetical protein
MNLGRDAKKHTKYPDESKGPSPLQIVGNEKAFKDRYPQEKHIFEQEREEHLKVAAEKMKLLQEARRDLYDQQSKEGELTQPKSRREDI